MKINIQSSFIEEIYRTDVSTNNSPVREFLNSSYNMLSRYNNTFTANLLISELTKLRNHIDYSKERLLDRDKVIIFLHILTTALDKEHEHSYIGYLKSSGNYYKKTMKVLRKDIFNLYRDIYKGDSNLFDNLLTSIRPYLPNLIDSLNGIKSEKNFRNNALLTIEWNNFLNTHINNLILIDINVNLKLIDRKKSLTFDMDFISAIEPYNYTIYKLLLINIIHNNKFIIQEEALPLLLLMDIYECRNSSNLLVNELSSLLKTIRTRGVIARIHIKQSNGAIPENTKLSLSESLNIEIRRFTSRILCTYLRGTNQISKLFIFVSHNIQDKGHLNIWLKRIDNNNAWTSLFIGELYTLSSIYMRNSYTKSKIDIEIIINKLISIEKIEDHRAIINNLIARKESQIIQNRFDPLIDKFTHKIPVFDNNNKIIRFNILQIDEHKLISKYLTECLLGNMPIIEIDKIVFGLNKYISNQMSLLLMKYNIDSIIIDNKRSMNNIDAITNIPNIPIDTYKAIDEHMNSLNYNKFCSKGKDKLLINANEDKDEIQDTKRRKLMSDASASHIHSMK